MNYTKTLRLGMKLLKSRLPQILSFVAGGGVVVTAVVAAVEAKQEQPDETVVQNYKKTIVATVVTIGCIAGSAKLYGSRLQQAEHLLAGYKKAALASGFAPVIGEKLAIMSEKKHPENDPKDDKLIIYDADNDFWFKATEADVLMGRIHLNECAEEYGTASVQDFYDAINSKYKDLPKLHPKDSDIRGWDVVTDDWFENHDCHTSIRFSFFGGYTLDDGTEYWVLQSYDPPLYSEYLGAPLELLANEAEENDEIWDRR